MENFDGGRDDDDDGDDVTFKEWLMGRVDERAVAPW